MVYLFFVFVTLWFIRQVKFSLFYLYLWQLKEYQVRRFLDHYRTEKGKKLIFNKLNTIKIFLFLFFFIEPVIFFFILLTVYFFESFKAIYDFFRKKLKLPVLTKKTAALIVYTFFVEILLLLVLLFNFQIFSESKDIYLLSFLLLVYDIAVGIITSFVVFSFQPFVIFWRNRIMSKAKKKIRKLRNLLVIGIAGSYGKSSTKEFLATILSEKFNVLKTEKNINAEVGIAQTVLTKLKPGHQIFIAEIGAYEKGKIKEVCEMIKPKIGILTGINQQHLSTFGSQENIIKAKFEIIENLQKNGIAILNGNNKYCFELCEKARRSNKINNLQEIICPLFYASTQKRGLSDIWAEDIKEEKEFIYFKVKTKKGDSANFKVNLLGKQNVENILLAVACSNELGMSLEEISNACLKIKPEIGGIKFLKKENPTILDSSYSANPTGVIADLDYLKIYSEKKIIIMPSLIELGKEVREIHKKIGKKIAEVCDLAIITTKDYFKEIKEGAIKSGMKEKNIVLIEKPIEIAKKTLSFGQESVILLEGRLPTKSKEFIMRLIIARSGLAQ